MLMQSNAAKAKKNRLVEKKGGNYHAICPQPLMIKKKPSFQTENILDFGDIIFTLACKRFFLFKNENNFVLIMSNIDV